MFGYAQEKDECWRQLVKDGKPAKREYTKDVFEPKTFTDLEDPMIARWPDGMEAQIAAKTIEMHRAGPVQRGPKRDAADRFTTTDGRSIKVKGKKDRNAIWFVEVANEQKCQIRKSQCPSEEQSKAIMIEVAKKLSEGAVPEEQGALYDLRDELLRKGGFVVPARRWSATALKKRPAAAAAKKPRVAAPEAKEDKKTEMPDLKNEDEEETESECEAAVDAIFGLPPDLDSYGF